MKIISVAIQKGGSGKTTTVVNLAAALRDLGKKVLLIDLDPQANLSQSLGAPDEPEENLYKVLKAEAFGESADLSSIIMQTCGMDLVPASLDLATAELELVSIFGRETIMAQCLERLKKKYDFVFLDCPPSIGMLTVNALTASDWVLMPLQAEFLPMRGVASFIQNLEKIRRLNKKLEFLGFVLTKYDHRKGMNRDVLEKLQANYGKDKVFETLIRTNISLAKAQEKGVDIFTFDKSSNGAADYRQLAEAFLKKV